MWMTVPDDFQVHMLDRELVNYCTGQPGIGLSLGSASANEVTPPTDPLVIQALAILTLLAKEAQVVVTGELAGQGLLIDPLPTPDPSGDLLKHVATHIAFEHMFLRIPGMASEAPAAWDKSIKGAHATLQKFVDGTLPLDPSFFTRGVDANVPPQQAVMRHSCDVDAAFAREWNLPSRRRDW
jgi:hypothetical protein